MLFHATNAEPCLESHDILKSHETDCQKFWQCAQGEWQIMDCPDGLEFSEHTSRCEFPTSAHCNKQKPSTKEPTEITPTTSECSCETQTPCPVHTTTVPTVTSTQTTTTSPFTTTDSVQTTKCSCGTTTPCPAHPTTTPSYVSTTLLSTTTAAPTSASPSTSTSIGSSTSSTPCPCEHNPTEGPTPKPSQCPIVSNELVLLPVTRCCQFIICENFGKELLFDCAESPAGLPALIFDPKTQRCEYPWDTHRNDCQRC